MSLVKILDLSVLGDSRGSLVSLEEYKDIPFSVKRVYYIFDTKAGVARGFHAHRNLKQLLICIAGSCKVILDNGEVRESVVLDSPNKALLVESMVWREMHDFSSDCVLLVLASDHYDESDYIRVYEDFLECVA